MATSLPRLAASFPVPPVPPSLVKPMSKVQHWELQLDQGDVGVPIQGRWLRHALHTPPCPASPPEPPLSPQCPSWSPRTTARPWSSWSWSRTCAGTLKPSPTRCGRAPRGPCHGCWSGDRPSLTLPGSPWADAGAKEGGEQAEHDPAAERGAQRPAAGGSAGGGTPEPGAGGSQERAAAAGEEPSPRRGTRVGGAGHLWGWQRFPLGVVRVRPLHHPLHAHPMLRTVFFFP